MTMKLPQVKIGILGGTGLYEIEGIEDIQEFKIDTPFGPPSDSFIWGKLEGQEVVFLSRHGRGHFILPSEINYRANIYGLKMLGVQSIISVNSCGSLKNEIKPLDIVLSDQFFDHTYRRRNTFFGEGLAAHVSFAQPVCEEVSQVLFNSAEALGLRVKLGGTYICIEGPHFSTKAESNIYRQWGCDVIGMTSVTEAKLAREAEMCYATMNLVTDYDVWHEDEEGVSVEMILENLRKNVHNAKAVIKKTLSLLPETGSESCQCSGALQGCLITRPDVIPQEKKTELFHIIKKYLD
ncbi:S-methyl-5'-thioadenosine phosphorylase [Acidobacteriota bacterium]